MRKIHQFEQATVSSVIIATLGKGKNVMEKAIKGKVRKYIKMYKTMLNISISK